MDVFYENGGYGGAAADLVRPWLYFLGLSTADFIMWREK